MDVTDRLSVDCYPDLTVYVGLGEGHIVQTLLVLETLVSSYFCLAWCRMAKLMAISTAWSAHFSGRSVVSSLHVEMVDECGDHMIVLDSFLGQPIVVRSEGNSAFVRCSQPCKESVF